MTGTGRESHALLFLAGAAVGVVGTAVAFRILSRQYSTLHSAANGHHHDCCTTSVHPKPKNSSSAVGDLQNFDKDEIISEQLTRNVQFFGEHGQRAVGGSFVVVVGLGGVGSHAAHMLLRSGVGRLRIVDFDQVTVSSLNRHCLATREDVGLSKAICLQNHFAKIFPEAVVEALCEMYTEQTKDTILAGTPDYVIDAIDNIDTKVSLLATCHARGIPVLCVAGAGAKADPTRMRFADVSQSTLDPLARAVRYRLRRDYGISSGIQVLLSTERPRCGLVASEEAANADSLSDYQLVPNFRIRTIPVLGTTPAAFGMAAAAFVLCELARAPLHPAPLLRPQPQALQTQYDRLEDREREVYGMKDDDLAIDPQEVEVVIREVFHGRSARSEGVVTDNRSLARTLGGLTLTRWDQTKPAAIDNVVLLTMEEAEAHDKMASLENLRAEEPELYVKVEALMRRARREFGKDVYYCIDCSS